MKEYKHFRKGEETHVWAVVNESKVLCNMNGICNPTLEYVNNQGWEIYTPEPEPVVLPTLEELTEAALRNGADGGSPTYSINQEFEVQRKRDEDPESFAIYNARVEACIAWANAQPHRKGSGGENV